MSKKSPTVNTKVVCIKSESPGYREGNVYTVTQRSGDVGLLGEDGFFDPWENLVSSFKPYKAKDFKIVT